jgi:hypothetical protein
MNHKMGYNFVTRGTLQHQLMNLKQEIPKRLDVHFFSLTGTQSDTMVTAVGGRPTGTSNVAKRVKMETMKIAVTEATQMYASEVEKTEACGAKSVASGTLTSIMSRMEQKYDLEPVTIHKRILRDNHTGKANQRQSPLANVEPLLVEYCNRLFKIGAPLT